MPKPFNNKIEHCKAGDIICAPDGSKARILARLGVLIFRSDWYQYEVAHYRPFTVKEAQDLGWKLLTKDGKTPYTKKEIENLMNIKIT